MNKVVIAATVTFIVLLVIGVPAFKGGDASVTFGGGLADMVDIAGKHAVEEARINAELEKFRETQRTIRQSLSEDTNKWVIVALGVVGVVGLLIYGFVRHLRTKAYIAYMRTRGALPDKGWGDGIEDAFYLMHQDAVDDIYGQRNGRVDGRWRWK